MNIEHRTLNVQHRIMYSVNLKKTEQDAILVLALHERINLTKLNSAELIAGCESVCCCLFKIDKA
jgi:hypothetical protein